MKDGRTVFQKAIDAMIEARMRQARRYVEDYRRTHGLLPDGDKR